MNLKNATALITGGSSGIGLAIAHTLAGAGSRVAITGRDEGRLKEAAKAVSAHAIKADVGSEEDVKRTYREFFDKFGHLDILVNSAGFGVRRQLVDMDLATFEAIFRTNVTGTMLMSREAAKHFIERKRGNIVNLASTAALRNASSRTTPPFPTCSRPTSNCGFTSNSHSASGATAASAGTTRRSEMNATSATTRSIASGTCAASRLRALVRSSTTTRGSPRSFASSCP
jgi:NAD(P)-dependent dehydrogenase (short-subunit alcohol dehydrogenase family)